MNPLVQRFLRTGIAFLLAGLGVGLWMLARRELSGLYPSPRLISAHTHVILVGFVMMMIMGVALWMFPRPERQDVRYRPLLSEVAYWLVAGGTAARFIGEAIPPKPRESLLGWIVLMAGIAQAAGLVIFFYNLQPRIRSARTPG